MRKVIKKEFDLIDSLNLHFVWQKFNAKFMTKENKWKYTGYRMMCEVEEWAKNWPKDVFLEWCNDDCHATSLLVLIEHRSKKDYMGTTVIYIPQCTGETPISFSYIQVIGKI